MTIRVVGAGLGRTGTHSLKIAFERLLGAPCYHMLEVMNHPEHIPIWERAAKGDEPDWNELFTGYEAVVDWPAASFWHDIASVFPDAIVLLSTRADASTWWTSAHATIFQVISNLPAQFDDGFLAMWQAIAHNRFTPNTDDEAAAKAAYERHNADVRRACRSGAVGRVAARRRLGAAVRRARRRRPRRTVSSRQHHRRLPRDVGTGPAAVARFGGTARRRAG